jgi:hypothetical protein
MNINEAALVKKLVNGKREPAPHAKDATEKIRSRSEMGNFAEKFGCMPFLLQRIGIVGGSYYLNIVRG